MQEVINKLNSHTKSFWQELLQFLKQYSVIGLAIGVITAQASKDLVDAIVRGVFSPLIKLIAPEGFSDLNFKLGSVVFEFGIVINAALTFIIVMSFLYIVVKKIIKNDELLEKK